MNNTPENHVDTDELTPIGELAKQLRLTTRTLRYWEEVGIIESAERDNGTIRGYTPYMVRRIRLIMKLKELGLTIKEMQDLYRVYGNAKRTDKLIPELIKTIDQHIRLVDAKMARIASLRVDLVEYRDRLFEKFARVSEQHTD
ncbi:MerR family transcriptional regulator [Chrysiogenes arsenatis]|uniref:helix-turn-helix domain-containing protein n=1 Tax=Chrysiogenes arsenatis TaxID=309797 RepID=UPI0004228042|nr:MerR family transcriptional regulator [Chrysiogenes arsenatis]